MGFRFRRSVRLFPGVRLNVGLRGMSVSAGVPGMTFNFGARRSSVTFGIPGTGLSYRHTLSGNHRQGGGAVSPGDALDGPTTPPIPQGSEEVLPGEIKSADIASLTSPDLEGLKTLINEAARQKSELQPDWKAATRARRKAWRKLRRREQPPLSLFMKGSISKAKAAFEEAEQEAWKVAEALAASEIKVEVELDAGCWAAWSRLEDARKRLAGSVKFWDVTSSVWVDRYRTRSAASYDVTRQLVGLRSITDGIVAGQREGMRFENANGGDLDIFPGFLLIRRKHGTDYALVDLRDLQVETYSQQFIERDAVPFDSQVIGYAWAKSNKDGSPDRRFNNNYRIPIALYGSIEFSTSGGLHEAYSASNCEAALEFGQALRLLQDELRRMAANPKLALPTPVDANKTHDPKISLPPLPNVWPALDTIVVPLVAVGLIVLPHTPLLPTGVALVSATMPSDTSSPLVTAKNVASIATASTTAPEKLDEASAMHLAAKPEPAHSQTPVPQNTPAGADIRATPAAPAVLVERVVTTSGANVRAGPARSAPALRFVAAGTQFTVAERQGSWVRVGDGNSEPWGWVHSSLLKKAP